MERLRSGHAAFRRNRPNAESVIDSKELERASGEKPASSFFASVAPAAPSAQRACDVSIVMPCLNEARSIPICIANAKAALAEMRDKLGLSGEILIADNGSEDGSKRLAAALGARVVDVTPRRYWSQHHFPAIRSALPAAVGAALLVVGAQNALGGFLLAIINGHEAEFLKAETLPTAAPAQTLETERHHAAD